MNTSSTAPEKSLTFDHGKVNVPARSIKCIESVYGNYSVIKFTNRKEILSAYTLNHYSSKLSDSPAFFNIRKGVLINLKHMKEIKKQEDGHYVKMKDGSCFRMSRRKGKALLAMLKN